MIISNKKIGLAKTGCILGRPNWIIRVEINNIDPIDKIRNKLCELEIFAILGKLLSINNKKTPLEIRKPDRERFDLKRKVIVFSG